MLTKGKTSYNPYTLGKSMLNKYSSGKIPVKQVHQRENLCEASAEAVKSMCFNFIILEKKAEDYGNFRAKCFSQRFIKTGIMVLKLQGFRIIFVGKTIGT